MNERIKQLMLEAGYAAPELAERANKLVELIVRECCQYLNSEAERLYALSAEEHRPNFKEDFEICAEKCYDNIQGIKEHFGVEE